MKKAMIAAALAASVLQGNIVHAQSDDEDRGSLYLRCDGEPNNITGGETFARFVGAITLLGLFAPSPESPDPSKRLFAEEGVDACSQLIDGEDAEGNAVRRVPLILARALHQIEAKDYPAALLDVDRAREEAAAAGLVGNAYFDRSMGLSFNNIEGAVHLRMGDPGRARDVSLSSIADMRYSFVPSLYADDFGRFLRDFSPEAEIKFATAGQIMPSFLLNYATRLDEVGRFAESAQKQEAMITVVEGINPELTASGGYARVAVTHALAGNWERANARATFARTNMAERTASGQPEDNASMVVELLDLFNILELAEAGDLPMARRLFSARSQWTAPSFGTVLEITRRLREGAPEEDLIGSLAQSADDMWQKRYDDLLAVELQSDTDNDTLYDLIPSYSKVSEFEDRARRTHRVERSRMMADEEDDEGQWAITATGNPYSAIDAVMLHAALQARHRGNEGFTMLLLSPRAGYGGAITTGFVRFLNRGEDGAEDVLFIPADAVIAELGQLIPTHEEVRARRRGNRD